MGVYSPRGKAHRVLERLAESDAGIAELAAHLGVPSRKGRRDKTWHLIGSMLRDELISGHRQNYYIRPEGRDALGALCAGHGVTLTNQTSVRVFA